MFVETTFYFSNLINPLLPTTLQKFLINYDDVKPTIFITIYYKKETFVTENSFQRIYNVIIFRSQQPSKLMQFFDDFISFNTSFGSVKNI